LAEQEETPPVVIAESLTPPVLSDPEPSDPSAAFQQVRHFYQVFFKTGDTAHPTARELAQADDHVTRLGEERARYLVTFAYREAKQTGFAIQTYGGILQYEGRALAEYEENVHKRREAIQQKARKSHEERFWDAYLQYLRETLARAKEAPSSAFSAFLEAEEKKRAEYAKGPLANNPAMKRVAQMFDEELARLTRFAEHFRGAAGDDHVFSFWEWDDTLNPARFSLDRPRGAISDVR
jgi:hypothetical protein